MPPNAGPATSAVPSAVWADTDDEVSRVWSWLTVNVICLVPVLPSVIETSPIVADGRDARSTTLVAPYVAPQEMSPARSAPEAEAKVPVREEPVTISAVSPRVGV